MHAQNIYVIGLMAVGKSTVGRLLAESLGRPFIDSDHEIEARAGAEISWIFDVEGEEGFRDREEQVIDELSQRDGLVLATGGGVVKRQINREHLAARGIVVYLDCPIEKLLERTNKDKRRPLLNGPNREEVLRSLMCERGPLYAEIADYRFVSGDNSAKSLVNKIISKLQGDGVI
ncbi:MAG: shikimate kinase AroK [Pseudomonadales bacterium]|nr:shikimate kinase AroK [Pseudomonadales bacterium]